MCHNILQSNWKGFYRERDRLTNDPNRQSSQSFVQLLEFSTNFHETQLRVHKDRVALVPKFRWEIYASRRRKSGCGTRQAQVEKVLENIPRTS